MEKLKKVDMVIAILFGSISLLAIVVLSIDIRNAYRDPQIYEMVHAESVAGYIQTSYGVIAAFAVGLLISAMTLLDRKRIRIWKKVLYGSLLLFVGVILYGYLSWAATGFDH